MSDDTTIENPISKTDAKELKSLVRSDYRMLHDELLRRREDLTQRLNKESHRRKAENHERATKEFRALQKRVATLNDAIVKKVTELGEQGWTNANNYRGTQVPNPHDFTVSIPNLERLTPPDVDVSDIDEAHQTVWTSYEGAARGLDRQEADFIRQLTLLSVTSETAREFVTNLPTPESLLPAPDFINQLPE